MKIARFGAVFSNEYIETNNIACRHPRAKRLDRYCRLAVAAAEALVAAAQEDPNLGVFITTEFACFGANAEHWETVKNGAPASPLVFPATAPSAAAGEIAMAVLAMGPNVTIVGVIEQAWAAAQSALEFQDCERAIVGVVEAWHPRLEEFGATPQTHDGACLALITRADKTPAFEKAPSQLLVCANAYGSAGAKE